MPRRKMSYVAVTLKHLERMFILSRDDILLFLIALL